MHQNYGNMLALLHGIFLTENNPESFLLQFSEFCLL